VKSPLLLLLVLIAPLTAAELTLDDVFGRPEGRLPRRMTFSPDGKQLAYLLERKNRLSDLWVLDLPSGAPRILIRAKGRQKLTKEQEAARERRRERGTGVTAFSWRPGSRDILVPRSGDLFLWSDKQLVRMTRTKAAERDAQWSPDGRLLAYVRDDNLFVRDVDAGKERQLTTWGGGRRSCGLAEFIAGEELGRHRGFWWSKDSKRIAYVRTDSTNVPRFEVPRALDARGAPSSQDYPRAGDANVSWSLRTHDLESGSEAQVPVSGEYLVRVEWDDAGAHGGLVVQTSNRSQRALRLSRWDGKRLVLLTDERDPAWLRFHRDFRSLRDGRYLWSSARSGWRHLYLDNRVPVTTGSWGVASVVRVDEEMGRVWFMASRENPSWRRLYSIGLDGKGLRVLTPEPGWHSVTASRDGRWFVDTYSRATVPPRVVLRDALGNVVRELARGKTVPGLVRPEFMRIKADDGTVLRAMLYRAARKTPGPAIVHTYAGPESHMVADRWGGVTHLWHQRMVQRGYSILKVDGRGTGGYGRAFSRVVSGRLCDWEVRDQSAGAKWLGKQPQVAATHIGVWGWSYGGTMTLMCLQNAGDVFAAGVAVAPVTDWHDYDTAYTERYLGLPKDNREAYRLSSPIFGAHKLKRPLLLAHGIADDNVHWRNAIAYVDAVQKAGRLIEMDFYPRGKHGIGGKPERKLLFRRMERFWDRELGE